MSRISAILFLCGVCGTIDGDFTALVLSFLQNSKASALVAFTCSQQGTGGVHLAKLLHAKGVLTQVFDREQSVALELAVQLDFTRLVVVVDVSCHTSADILRKASDARLFSRLHHWLLVGPSAALDAALAGLSLPLDSHVTTAVRDVRHAGLVLRDAYRTGTAQPVVFTATQPWSPGTRLQPRPLRTDLQGLPLRVAIVVVEDDWAHHDDLTYKHLNMWSKYDYVLITLIAQRFNFTLRPVFTDTWGYLVNGSFTGMVALLQKGQADFGAGIAMKSYRMGAISYTSETGHFWPQFLLRQPSLSTVTNIYTLPFARAVWATYLTTVLVLTITLIAMQRLMGHVLPEGSDEGPPPQWADTFLFAFGILCDEGYPETPYGLSSRILLLFLLMLSVFHLTSYSACIVSLLQTPSTGIDTLSELLDSPLKLAMQDIPYNVNFNNETNDPLVHKLYRERLHSQSRQRAFISIAEGVERVRAGLFAFHVDIGAYQLVSDTFLEHEKCGLKQVPMFPKSAVTIPVTKDSPYRETIITSLRWIKETGLMNREWRRWATHKPECLNRESGFVSVGLQEFYPVLTVLGFGLLGATLVLLLEQLLHALKRFRMSRH